MISLVVEIILVSLALLGFALLLLEIKKIKEALALVLAADPNLTTKVNNFLKQKGGKNV